MSWNKRNNRNNMHGSTIKKPTPSYFSPLVLNFFHHIIHFLLFKFASNLLFSSIIFLILIIPASHSSSVLYSCITFLQRIIFLHHIPPAYYIPASHSSSVLYSCITFLQRIIFLANVPFPTLTQIFYLSYSPPSTSWSFLHCLSVPQAITRKR